VKLTGFRKCLAEYTVHNLVTLLVLLTVLRCRTVLPDGHFCNNAILHACVQEKFRAIPSTYWCNFKRFNTILKSEVLLNLIRKMKYLTDQF